MDTLDATRELLVLFRDMSREPQFVSYYHRSHKVRVRFILFLLMQSTDRGGLIVERVCI